MGKGSLAFAARAKHASGKIVLGDRADHVVVAIGQLDEPRARLETVPLAAALSAAT